MSALKVRETERSPLSVAERDRLQEIEAKIHVGRVSEGQLLDEVRTARLYRERFASFEDYLSEQWGYSKQHGYRLIAAGTVVRDVTDGTGLPAPENERQARPMVALEPAERREAWADAVAAAGGAAPTANQVAASVAKVAPRSNPLGDSSAASKPAPKSPKGSVEWAKETGVIPAGAEVFVTEAPPQEPGESPAYADDDKDHAVELPDDEWLETLPQRSKLPAHLRAMFDAEAVGYRALTPARVAFRAASKRVTDKVKKGSKFRIGPWLSRHGWYFLLKHPRDGPICEPCQGTGTGAAGQCPKCHGNGYHV